MAVSDAADLANVLLGSLLPMTHHQIPAMQIPVTSIGCYALCKSCMSNKLPLPGKASLCPGVQCARNPKTHHSLAASMQLTSVG